MATKNESEQAILDAAREYADWADKIARGVGEYRWLRCMEAKFRLLDAAEACYGSAQQVEIAPPQDDA